MVELKRYKKYYLSEYQEDVLYYMHSHNESFSCIQEFIYNLKIDNKDFNLHEIDDYIYCKHIRSKYAVSSFIIKDMKVIWLGFSKYNVIDYLTDYGNNNNNYNLMNYGIPSNVDKDTLNELFTTKLREL